MAHLLPTAGSTADTYEEVTLNLANDAARLKKPADPHLLSTTTGGMESSCRLCLMAFGTVFLLIGMSSTGVALYNDSPRSTLSVLGLIFVGMGGIMVAGSCLRSYFKREKPGRKESFSMLMCETEEKKPTV